MTKSSINFRQFAVFPSLAQIYRLKGLITQRTPIVSRLPAERFGVQNHQKKAVPPVDGTADFNRYPSPSQPAQFQGVIPGFRRGLQVLRFNGAATIGLAPFSSGIEYAIDLIAEGTDGVR